MSDFKKISPLVTVTGGAKNYLIGSPLQSLKARFYNVDAASKDEIIAQSLLNTPVYDNLVFEGGTYTDLKGNEIEYPELRIDNVLIEVSQRKNIVKTQIQGRDGTIKELISMGDYEISIRGILQNFEKSEQALYPVELATNLRKICESTQSLHVLSKFLSEVFDVGYIVIDSFSIPQVEGIRNLQPFTISALSDVEYLTPELI